jgi:hypothetical protein
MKPTIEVTISPTGEVHVDALGFKGPHCEQATRYLEHALGVASNRLKKPEYQARSTTRNQQPIGT